VSKFAYMGTAVVNESEVSDEITKKNSYYLICFLNHYSYIKKTILTILCGC